MSKQIALHMDFGLGQHIEAGIITADGPAFAVTLGKHLDAYTLPGMAGGNFTSSKLPYWLADALPDAWGQRVMRHEMIKAGLPLRNISVVDQLAYIGNSGLGCWQFLPTLELSPDLEKVADLAWLRDQTLKLFEDRDCNLEWMIGSLSLGGARPKVFVDLDATGAPSFTRLAREREWILKFPGPRDAPDAGKWEVAYARLARAYGMNVQPCELVQGEYFATRRFDAVAGRRYLLRTLGSLNEADHSDAARNSYDSILEHMGALCDYTQVRQVLKLALFNHLMLNWDDHAKNVSFLMDGEGRWQLAPFYDLTYNLALGSHAMALNATTMPEKSDFVEVFGVYGLDKHEVAGEAALLEEIIRRDWERIAAEVGIEEGMATRRKREILQGFSSLVD